MKRQVVAFNDLGFWVSSGYAPVRVSWSALNAISATVYQYPLVSQEQWRVLGVHFAPQNQNEAKPEQLWDSANNDVLELHEDTLGLDAFRAELYRRFSVSRDDQTRLEQVTPEQPHTVRLRNG